MANRGAGSDVGARYARALIDLAVEQTLVEAVEADLGVLKRALAESRELRTLIASPRFTFEDKGRGLSAVAERAGVCELTRKFVGLLALNRRTGALAEVIAAFERLAAERRGFIAAKVTTAAPMTKAQEESLAAALRAALGRDPQVETSVDPALLGGLKVRVGSRLYDATLKTKLDSLKFALKRA